jgi:hypothetical protein
MTERQQPRQSEFVETLRQAEGFCRLALNVLTGPYEWLVKQPGTRGSRVDGLESLAGLFVLSIWLICVWPDNPEIVREQVTLLMDMGIVCWGSMGLLLLHKLATAVAVARGRVVHSFDIGRSWFCRFGVSNEAAKALEVGGGIVMGIILLAVYFPLGSYLICAAGGLGVQYALIRAREKALRQLTVDARLEQQQLHGLIGC